MDANIWWQTEQASMSGLWIESCKESASVSWLLSETSEYLGWENKTSTENCLGRPSQTIDKIVFGRPDGGSAGNAFES